MSLLFKLAFRNLLRQRRRSILTGLSMTGGFVLLALSLSLVEGSYSGLIEMFTSDHTGHIQVHKNDYLRRPDLHKNLDDGEVLEELLQSHPDILAFAPRIHAPALAYGGSKTLPVTLTGIDPRQEVHVSLLKEKIQKGSFFKQADMAAGPDHDLPALIGRTVADSLKLSPGDELVLISKGADGSIANDLFRVAGIVGNRSSWEKQRVFLPLPAAREFLAMPGRVHEYVLKVPGYHLAEEVAASLREKSRNKDWEFSSWQQVEASFYRSMQSDKRGNQVTLGIIIFLVCLGVLNTVVMSVLERTREFGLLKAQGTSPGRIFFLIETEVLLLALASCLAGLLIALPLITWFTLVGITLDQAFDMGGISYDTLRGSLSPDIFVTSALVILSSAAAVSLLPSLRAARIKPVDALRS